MSMRKVILSSATLAIALWLAPGAGAADPIKIGIVGPNTGPADTTGLTVTATWKLVADEYNGKGGIAIDGEQRLIELLPADSQSKPSTGVSAAQRLLTRDQVDILVGDTLHSDVTLAIMELATAFPDTLFYAPLPVSSTISDKIRDEPEKYGNVWKWDADTEAYATSIADFMTSDAAAESRHFENKTYAIVAEQTNYSSTIAESVKEALAGTSWELLTSEGAPVGSTDYYSQITKIKSLDPDVVISIMTAANSGLAYIKQSREQAVEYEDIGVYYPGLPPFMKGVGSDGNGLIFFTGTFDTKSERGREFADLMVANDIPPSGDAVLGYCSATVMFDAVARAGSLDAAKIGDALLETDDDTCANYQRIVFDPKRHSPLLGPDHAFMPGAQLYADGKEFFIFYPERAATGKLDELP